MGSSEKNIASKWPEKMKEMQKKYHGHMPPNELSDSCLNIIVVLVKSLDSNWIKEFQAVDNAGRDLLRSKLGAIGQDPAFNSIFAHYSNLYNRNRILTDARKQEESSATWDHVKTLFFRTLTTLMIASIILATGFIAHRYDIPLPLLRSL